MSLSFIWVSLSLGMVIAQAWYVKRNIDPNAKSTSRAFVIRMFASALFVNPYAASVSARENAQSCVQFTGGSIESRMHYALPIAGAGAIDRWVKEVHPRHTSGNFDVAAYVERVAVQAAHALDPDSFLFLQSERSTLGSAADSLHSDLMDEIGFTNKLGNGPLAHLQDVARDAITKCKLLLLDPGLQDRIQALVNTSVWTISTPTDEVSRSKVFEIFIASIARNQIHDGYPFADSYRFALRRVVRALRQRADLAAPSSLPTLILQAKLKALDPNSSYTPPAVDELLTSTPEAQPDAQYVGIGVGIMAAPYGNVIHVAMPGSAAKRAGLRTGDVILAVDGVDVREADEDDVSSRLRGAADVAVRVRLKRGARIIDIEVMRSEHQRVTGVTSTIRVVSGQKIGVINLDWFSKTTAVEALVKLDSLRPKVSGVVLNLIGNHGGFLASASEILGQYLVQDTPLVELIGHDAEMKTAPPVRPVPFKAPLVVLINDQSASASEVVAGALQAHGRAVIVGVRSYGKGTYQIEPEPTDAPMTSAKGTLRITGGYFYLPNGRSPQHRGILPDIEIASAAERPRPFREADIKTSLATPPDIVPKPGVVPLSVATLQPLREASAARQAARQTGAESQDEESALAEAAAIAADMVKSGQFLMR